MSGTSMDGLDCGLFEISLTTDNYLNWEFIDYTTVSYSKDIRESICNALVGDEAIIDAVDRKLGKEFSLITEQFIKGRNIDFIATHGQTIAHDDGVSTRQIGDVQYLRKIFQVPIISISGRLILKPAVMVRLSCLSWIGYCLKNMIKILSL